MGRQNLCVAVLVVSCAGFICERITNITECGLTCSQGIHCKRKPSYFFHNNMCQNHSLGLSPSVLQSMHVSTVIKCTRDTECSVHLDVKTALILKESIRGIEICSYSLDTLHKHCTTVTFPKTARKKFDGNKVRVQYNCFEVNIAQQIHVVIKTIPYYCGVIQEQDFHVEDCSNEDFGKHIPLCIAGKLTYKVQPEQKVVAVQVSEFLENHDYHVRLCHKWFTCENSGTIALIKKEDKVKKVTLPYSELLPCLCIEGWSAIEDARRIHVCPFTNYTEELWKGITYNPVSQELHWKSLCPVQVNTSLCWLAETKGICIDLPHTSHKVQGKVIYKRTDTHPRLCMKFTTDQGTWVKCPFMHGLFQAWSMNIGIMPNDLSVTFTSQVKATFSVFLCNESALSVCHLVGEEMAIPDKSFSGNKSIRISKEMCGSHACIKGYRTDVDYSIPDVQCNIPCSITASNDMVDKYVYMVTIVTLLVVAMTLTTLIGYKTLKVLQRRKYKFKRILKSQVHHISLNPEDKHQHVPLQCLITQKE
ncbi:putative interleukin-17 receptor E-like [Protopterus annectens]|uniref:putative interleukin-17 receptor E-like n=1 Tax=Protopterus annectens TaxID=7888 RepID=UPI001CFA6CB5|nr:putative interleukin-17 receptor E-like [Protopterus annectens]